MDINDPWIPFFEYLVSAGAAILAIAFLTFQFRAEVWRGHPLKRLVAVRTLAELATPVFFGLIYLMPSHSWVWAGGIVGFGGFILIGYYFIAFHKYRHLKEPFDTLQRLGSFVILLLFAILAWPWEPVELWWKAGICTWMIFSGLGESWIFLRPRPPSDNAASGATRPEVAF